MTQCNLKMSLRAVLEVQKQLKWKKRNQSTVPLISKKSKKLLQAPILVPKPIRKGFYCLTLMSLKLSHVKFLVDTTWRSASITISKIEGDHLVTTRPCHANTDRTNVWMAISVRMHTIESKSFTILRSTRPSSARIFRRVLQTANLVNYVLSPIVKMN